MRKDTNLLLLFRVLYEERNVTSAAERMALSQPALSHRLNKLRAEFRDALFVRAARGLTPTPKAREIAPKVLALVRDIESFYQTIDHEDFLARHETIRIFTTDYVEYRMLPGLLSALRREAPNVQIVSQNARGRLPKVELENGSCDIAVGGFFRDPPESLYQQSLFEEDFVVVAWRDNTEIDDRLDLSAYLRCAHLVTTLTGDLNGLVDQALEAQGRLRKIVAGVSSFLAPPTLIGQSDLLLTCLRSIGEAAATANTALRVYPCPVDIGAVRIAQVWHERTHGDLLRQWIRRRLFALANATRPG